MSVAIRKLDGVESVDVSLERASADIRLKPSKRITLPQLRQVIKSNGYPTKDAHVEARGRFVDRGATAVFDLENGSTLELTAKPKETGMAIVNVTGVSRPAGRDREQVTVSAIK